MTNDEKKELKDISVKCQNKFRRITIKLKSCPDEIKLKFFRDLFVKLNELADKWLEE